MTKKKNVTAAELMAELEADPEWVARRDAKERQRQRREDEIAQAEVPLVEALAAVGIRVTSVWDLVNTAIGYDEAIPVLLEHLHRPYRSEIRSGIARALAMPSTRFAWPTLKTLFENEREENVKDGLACALAVIADESLMDEMIALTLDRRHGSSRVLLLSALERSGDPRAYETLVELGPELEEARIILKRLERKKRDR